MIVVSLASVIVAGDTSYDRTDQASEAASAAARANVFSEATRRCSLSTLPATVR